MEKHIEKHAFGILQKLTQKKKVPSNVIQPQTGRSLLKFISKIKDFIDSMTLDQ